MGVIHSNNISTLKSGLCGGRWKLDKPIKGLVAIECQYHDKDCVEDGWGDGNKCTYNVDTKALVSIPENRPIIRHIGRTYNNNGEIYHPQPEQILRTDMLIIEKIYGVNNIPEKELCNCIIKYDRWSYTPSWLEVGKTNTFVKFSDNPRVKSSIKNGFKFELDVN